MSISKGAILDQKNLDSNKTHEINIGKQLQNKSMSDSNIDLTKLRQKYQLQQHQQQRELVTSSLNSKNIKHVNDQESNYGCAIM